MTIETLKRVMQRLRKQNPGDDRPTINSLRIATIKEIGYHHTTIKRIRKALVTLGWIKYYSTQKVTITNKDLTDS